MRSLRREQNDQCVSRLPFDVGRAVTAMRCQKCERMLSEDEPVYRVGVGYDGALYCKLRCRSVGHVCENCRSHPYEPSRDSKPKPCGSCGRPVIDVGRRNPRKHVSCGPNASTSSTSRSPRRSGVGRRKSARSATWNFSRAGRIQSIAPLCTGTRRTGKRLHLEIHPSLGKVLKSKTQHLSRSVAAGSRTLSR